MQSLNEMIGKSNDDMVPTSECRATFLDKFLQLYNDRIRLETYEECVDRVILERHDLSMI